MASPLVRTRKEFVRRRYDRIVDLIAHHQRSGETDPESGYEIGTYAWIAHQIVKEMGHETWVDIEGVEHPALPKNYYMGGEVAAMTVGRDYHRIRELTKTRMADTIEAIRNYKTHDLEYLNGKIYQSIIQRGVDQSIGLITKYLEVNEQIFRLNGLHRPVTQANVNLNIDFSRLSREQLDRIASGEPPELVLSESYGDDADEVELIEAEYVEIEEN